MMSEKEFQRLESFLEKNASDVIAMDDLNFQKRKKNILEKVFERVYWKILAKKKAKREKANQKKKEDLK